MDIMKDIRIVTLDTDKPEVINVIIEDQQENITLDNSDSQEKVIPMYDEVIVKKGFSPFINEETETWFEYDNQKKVFVDTGVVARGQMDQATINKINNSLQDLEDNKVNIADLANLEEDPTVPDWAKEPTPPTYTAQDVQAVPASNTLSTKDIDDIFKNVFGNMFTH